MATLITGSTSFLGKALLEEVLQREKKQKIVLVVRDRSRLNLKKVSNYKNVEIIESSIEKLNLEENLNITRVIHIAGPASQSKELHFEELVFGHYYLTMKLLQELRRTQKSKVSFFYFSSGAVYGNRMSEKCSEQDELIISNQKDAYSMVKILTEGLVLSQSDCFSIVILRPFAFIGSLMSKSQPFAVSDFIYSALTSKKIFVNSDGKAKRTYMDLHDFGRVAYELIFNTTIDSGEIINIGSANEVSISDVAHLIAKNIDGTEVVFSGNSNSSRYYYVPDLDKLRSMLPYVESVTLEDSIVGAIKTFQL